ncbi:MAG: leucine-rich repeat domain-containing protein, partial [Eubacterium sp.]|nr:leucine-rich repeat domain-containing protein [Eubacterium sp.]
MKKVISVLLSISLLLTIIASSVTAYSLGNKPPYPLPSSGECGDNASYTFDSGSGLLTISGSGEITDSARYQGYEIPFYVSPFFGNADIKKVVINNGITYLGDYTFNGCTGITAVSLPDGLTEIGCSAFNGCTSLSSINFPSSLKAVRTDALYNTPYYNNGANWEKGILYVNSLIAAVENTASITVKSGVKTIPTGMFNGLNNLQ